MPRFPKFTPEEDQQIIQLWPQVTSGQMKAAKAAEIIGRPTSSVCTRAHKLGVTKPDVIPSDLDETIAKLNSLGKMDSEIASVVGIGKNTIGRRRRAMGLPEMESSSRALSEIRSRNSKKAFESRIANGGMPIGKAASERQRDKVLLATGWRVLTTQADILELLWNEPLITHHEMCQRMSLPINTRTFRNDCLQQRLAVLINLGLVVRSPRLISNNMGRTGKRLSARPVYALSWKAVQMKCEFSSREDNAEKRSDCSNHKSEC